MQAAFFTRVKIISAFVIFLSLLIIVKLFFVQVIHGTQYSERADRQYATPSGGLFDRGSIFFTTKDGEEVSAATTTLGYKVAIDPKEIINPEKTYALLNGVKPLDHATFIAQAAKKNDPYEEVLTHLTRDEADAISAGKLPGIYLYQDRWRVYPGNNLASRTLGFVAYKGNDLSVSGRYGLEQYYDDTLQRSGNDLYVNFFAELFSDLGKVVFHNTSQQGDIVTTIEPTVQDYLEGTLQKIQDTWHTQESGGIIINPKTGEIYAMAAKPDFNLNDFAKADPSDYENPLVQNVYELGSVIKTLTMSAGIDAGLITPETTYDDKGCLTLNGKSVCNFDKRGRGVINMQEVLNESLNTGATFVMQKLGREKFRDYMLAFGLGQKTGIDLPGEVQSLVSNLNSNYDVDYATASFGQGIALTPIAAARAFSAIANGGTLITPHIVKKIEYQDGGSKTITYPDGPRIIKQSTAETVTGMLVKIVDSALFNGTEKLDHYSVTVKSGTAQIAKPDGTGYYADRYLHSMYGYFPAYDPQFLVLLYDINPQGTNYAASTLGHPYLDTAKFLLNYYNVPPDR